MKIIFNNLIPFKGFHCINIFGVLFVRNEYKEIPILQNTITHETIHTKQMQEMGYIFFYIWYFIEWLIKLIIRGIKYGCDTFEECSLMAYYSVSLEREAYSRQTEYTYPNKRKHYAWLKFLIRR